MHLVYQQIIHGKCSLHPTLFNTFEPAPNIISKIPKISFIPEIKI